MMHRTFSPFVLAASLVLAAGATAPPALAQGAIGTISGTVRERGTERALPGVQIRVVGTQRGAVTDPSGRYRIAALPTGTVQLVAQHIGYAPQPRTVTLTTSGVTADFTLAVAATTLDQLTSTFAIISSAHFTIALLLLSQHALLFVVLLKRKTPGRSRRPGVSVFRLRCLLAGSRPWTPRRRDR